MRERRLWQAHEFVAVNAGFLLKALFKANADLRAETVMLGVNRCADHGREPRINQSLTAYDDKNTLFARIARSRLSYEI